MSIRQIVLAARPIGTPVASVFRQETVELPLLESGDVHVRGLYYSVDPYIRSRMNDTKSSATAFALNQPITGAVVAKVIDSRNGRFQPGDIVAGLLPWATEAVIPAKGLYKIDTSVAPPSYYLGILGMPGLTAYFGLMDIGKPKANETVVVSGAAGAIGIVVGQIAHLLGCRVVGIAGSDEKIALLTSEFGFDDGINYKSAPDLTRAVADACPDGVDIYFDNVGGDVSDAVIRNLNFHARIALCGQIALYNVKEVPVGPRLAGILLTRSVLQQGFVVSDYQERFPEGIAQLATWVRSGKLKYRETIHEGFDQLPKAFLGLFSGENIGKMIVTVPE